MSYMKDLEITIEESATSRKQSDNMKREISMMMNGFIRFQDMKPKTQRLYFDWEREQKEVKYWEEQGYGVE